MYKKLKERITETTQYYLLRNVHPRAEQPFQVRDDEEMQELVESIEKASAGSFLAEVKFVYSLVNT